MPEPECRTGNAHSLISSLEICHTPVQLVSDGSIANQGETVQPAVAYWIRSFHLVSATTVEQHPTAQSFLYIRADFDTIASWIATMNMKRSLDASVQNVQLSTQNYKL